MSFDVNSFFAALPEGLDVDELKALVPTDMWEKDAETAAVLALRRSGKFDEEAYLNAYPDVKESGMGAIEHYVRYGIGEQRRLETLPHRPKVSVIIPVYNNAQYLSECIESVIKQTLKEIEIIIVNDGSTDIKAIEILYNYAKKDNRIKLVHKKNTGYGHTMNIGLSKATGEYIGIVESDDYIDITMYSVLYDIAKKTGVDIVQSDLRTFFGKNENRKFVSYDITHKKWYNTILVPEYAIESFNANGMLGTTSAIYSHNFLKEKSIHWNNTPGASYQDIGFWFKTRTVANYIYYVDKKFYNIRRDNECSSVHDASNLFPVCYEYESIKRFILNRKYINKNFYKLLIKRKFLTYQWCLNRADASVKNKFLDRYIIDFKEHEFTNTLYMDYFNNKEKKILLSILEKYDPNKHKFVCIYTASLAHGGLEKAACNLSIILKEMSYGVIFFLLYDETFSYDFSGDYVILNLHEKNNINILNISDVIFDFKFKKITPIEYFVDYCVKNYAKKYISTIHSCGERCKYYFDQIKQSMNKNNIKSIKSIICVSEKVREDFITYYGNMHNLVTVHNPIKSRINKDIIKPYQEYSSFILLCCRLDATFIKGIDIVLKSFLQSKTSDDTYLLCVGNGQIEEKLMKELKKYNNYSKIIQIGFTEDIYSIMVKAKFLISASRYEGFPMVLLESLACNTPVLTTDVGGARELIIDGENGYIIKNNSIDQFSKYIDYMNETCFKFKKDFSHYINSFLFEKYKDKIEHVIKSNKNPSVSVIVPIYNSEEFIRKTLNSILSQTLTDIEIICIDDGSTDSSRSIVESFNDPRIIYKYQKNYGAGAARNVGLSIAQGEFIAFMDSDDFYPNNDVLTVLYNRAIENKVKVSGGNLYLLDNDKLIPNKDFEYVFCSNRVINYEDWQMDYVYQAFIFKRDIIGSIKFPLYKRFQDPVFFVKVMFAAKKIAISDQYSYVYRVRKQKNTIWTQEKMYDLFCGIYDNLVFAKNNNLDKLMFITLLRYEQHKKQIDLVINKNTLTIVQKIRSFVNDII